MKLTTSQSHSVKQLLKIGLLANMFEWYEFSVFNYLAITIGQLFFQSEYAISELLKVFTVFAISYFIRPIGSIFFGIIGDRYGRKYALRLSLMLMTVPTIFIGLLPTYSQIGITATIILIFLRAIQGFAMGGELPATACYIFEAAPLKYRSLLCSTVGAAPKIGLLLGSLTTYLLTRYFDNATLLSWGWRIPFLLGIPLTVFIAHVRKGIQETTHFEAIKQSDSFSIQLRRMWPILIRALQLCCFLNVGLPILTIWMPFYLNHFLGVSLISANLLNTIVLLIMIIVCLLAGYLSKAVDYRYSFSGVIIATLLLIFPIFQGIQLYATRIDILLVLFTIFAILVGITQGIFFELVNEMFPTEVRSLGVSLTCIIPAALIAGTIPLVCTYVIHRTGWLLFPAFYIFLSGLVALPAALTSKTHK